MPFTFAHPAIVLPFMKLKKVPVCMSALVIGSVAPDFEYFIRMKLSGRYSHSIEGMFLLDLPVAILLLLIFHQLVKQPLIDNLPSYGRGRLIELQQFNLIHFVTKNYYQVVLYLLIGIVSHIAWDSFTHSNEYFVKKFSLLRDPVTLLNLSMPLYRWLQHLSTTVGFIVIGVVFHNQPWQPAFKRISYQFWLLLISVSVICFIIRASLEFEYFGDQVATAISSLCIGLIVSSVIARLKHD